MKNQKRFKGAPIARPFFNLDTRQVTVTDLGDHLKNRDAFNARTALGLRFGHIFTDVEHKLWLKALRFQKSKYGSLSKRYYYLDGRDNLLVELGVFKDIRAAKTASLVTHFGIPQLFIADGERLLFALEATARPEAVQSAKEDTTVNIPAELVSGSNGVAVETTINPQTTTEVHDVAVGEV